MANSSIIGVAKNKIIRKIIKNEDIVKAIDSPTVDPKKPQELIYKHIFDYHQNPFTLDTVETFLTIQVHIPHTFDTNKTFVKPTVEIWIISHQRHMRVDEIPKVTVNRNDYLSQLIDSLLNGCNDIGIGTLKLESNVEGSFQMDYLYRKMIFVGTDLNDSLCIDE